MAMPGKEKYLRQRLAEAQYRCQSFEDQLTLAKQCIDRLNNEKAELQLLLSSLKTHKIQTRPSHYIDLAPFIEKRLQEITRYYL